jgi:hypothetical protein
MPTLGPRTRNRQSITVDEDKWELLKTLAPQYGLTANGLIYHLVDRLLEQHGLLERPKTVELP